MNNLSILLKECDGRGLSEDQLIEKFEDIAKAPKGAMYNVTIFVPRI